LITFLATAEGTDGQFGLIEFRGRKGGEPPAHLHHGEADKHVNGPATVPVGYPRVLTTFGVLAVNTACSPIVTGCVAGEAATWPNRPAPIDEELTWEDGACQ
jgi:hypothetical protein